VLAGLLAVLQRRLPAGSRWVHLTLAAALLLDSAMYYGYLAYQGNLTFPGRLPLELCDFSLYLTIVALFTLNKTAFELAYYWALAGASMAMLTPNLLDPCPSFGAIQFFVAHGLTIVGVLYLTWSGEARPRPGSVLRAMGVLNLVAIGIGAFDYLFQTDYMYLRAKPQSASLLDLLGPWPWYILATEFVAGGLFLLLYLPFRVRGHRLQEMAPARLEDGSEMG
jgi:hypothetical integral membrane protein (TIGR02206 family)